MGLAVAAVVGALLLLPAFAAAAIQVEVEGNGLVVSGDDQPNQIALSVGPNGKLAVNGVETTLVQGAVVIVVESGAGDDTVDGLQLAATDYNSMVVRGGPGDDLLRGGAAADTFAWANGDNSDEVIGGVGDDELELSGAPTAGDNVRFGQAARPDWVLLRREETAAVKAFEIELLGVETTAIHTEGGDDFTAGEGPVGIGPLTRLLIDGGPGNDQLGGSDGADEIDGGPGEDLLAGAAGEDRLFGSTGPDRLFGEGGDDQMFWANGDGRDEDVGGAGDDQVQLSGHPTGSDVLFYRPSSAQLGWVFLHRQETPDGSVKPFEIELLDVETFVVNTLGGRDKVEGEGPEGVGALTNLVLQGGSGDDELAASDGDDRLRGGPGDDLLFDGPGDDIVSWQPGDGDEDVQAFPSAKGESDLVALIGSELNDRVRLSREAGVTRLAGTAPAGATFEIATEGLGGDGKIERFGFAGEGGPDDFTVEPGIPDVEVFVGGGLGEDHLSGGDEPDLLLGGPEEDTLTGGPGRDILAGEDGADRLLARDGEADLVEGGGGTDAAQTDAVPLDRVLSVEDLDALSAGPPSGPGGPRPGSPLPQGPAPDPRALLPTLGRPSIAAAGRVLVLPLACQAAEAGGCRVSVAAATAKRVRGGGRSATLKLGAATIDLAAGQRGALRLRLPVRVAALAGAGRLAIRLRLRSTDAAGNVASRSATVVLPRGRARAR